jgi:hypothetical protein
MIEVRDLLARIDEAWTELNDCVGRLGADGLTITGADGWAVKDHLTHIGAWELLLLALLEGRERNAGNTYDHYAEHIAWIGELAAKRS